MRRWRRAVAGTRGCRLRSAVALFGAALAMLALWGREPAAAAIAPQDALPQTISFTQPSSPVTIGASAALSATGGASGEPVTFSVDGSTSPSYACSVSQISPGDWTVYYSFTGTCVIDANQAANGDYAAAPTVSRSITVLPYSSSVSLSPASAAYGQRQTVVASVSAADGTAPAGMVQFSENGTMLGQPVTLTRGTATSPELTGGGTLAPGTYSISAVFTPASGAYASALSAAAALTVEKAATATQAAVSGSALSATVAVTTPGAGTPTGSVSFSVDGTSVGTATLRAGTATLAYTVPTGAAHEVTATYSGDADFVGSTGAVTRSDPTITATLASTSTESTRGWYDAPVTVSFACTAATAPLTSACPAPVTLSGSGASQSVSETITATDGGSATALVTGINIDQIPPIVRVTGVQANATYETAPKLTCLATDDLSGFKSCQITKTTKTSASGLESSTVTYTGTASDYAGNTAQITGTYQLLGLYLNQARYSDGRFLVRAGRSYTLIVRHATARPRFVTTKATPITTAASFKSTGGNGWKLTLKLPGKLFAHSDTGQIRVRVAGKLHSIPIKRG